MRITINHCLTIILQFKLPNPKFSTDKKMRKSMRNKRVDWRLIDKVLKKGERILPESQ